MQRSLTTQLQIKFGMQDVSKHYHLGSFHQSQEMFEIPCLIRRHLIIIPQHQAILKNAAYAANTDNYFNGISEIL